MQRRGEVFRASHTYYDPSEFVQGILLVVSKSGIHKGVEGPGLQKRAELPTSSISPYSIGRFNLVAFHEKE